MRGIWKYRDLLPSVRNRVTLGEGGTPLFQISSEIFLKDESRNPTGSFEDRASAFAVSWLLDRGVRKVICDDDIDRCLSLATYSAAAGLECFAPLMNLPLSLLGAKFTEERVSLREPFYHLGEMTIAFEIAEEVEPDAVVIPMGSGSNVVMVWKGFRIASEAGMIERLPKIFAVRPRLSKGSIARELTQEPLFLKDALRAVKESGGRVIEAGDEEIIRAQRSLAKMGFLMSSSGSVAYSAIKEVREMTSVFLLTGRFRGFTRKIGETKEIILSILAECPSSGYSLWKSVSEHRKISIQAIYQHLRELEEREMVEKRDGKYHVTSKGRMLLAEI
ncbi:MAG: threonine synthase [Archaeoglobi archaeon]|nr:pyridoxal-phosphate dependent enzyme [Candidatus Mnemosynella bozhongmuii]MDK2782358.1 threonine synthase [Archaeoglobi archaeon]